MNNEDQLNPLEQALQAEGNSLLKAIAGGTGSKPLSIVGPNGEALQQEQPKPKEDPTERLKKLADEMAERMQTLGKEDPKALELMGVISNCNRLIYWACSEMAHNDVDSDLVDYIRRYMAAHVFHTQFTLSNVLANMKKEVLPSCDRYLHKAETERTIRARKLSKYEEVLRNTGFTMLTPGMAAKVENYFACGDVLLLHGTPEAITAAMVRMTIVQPSRSGLIYYLTAQESGVPALGRNCKAMARTWWADAAERMTRLYETLNPFTQDAAALMMIESLDLLYSGSEGSPLDRQRLALMRLRQWAAERMAAVVVGLPEATAGKNDAYGGVPIVRVELADGELSIDGEPVKRFGE